MLTITNTTTMSLALDSHLNPAIKALLVMRRDQLLSDTGGGHDIGELANWIIVAPGDPLAAIETAAGYPIAPDPPWEWVIDHGGIMEAPIILSDDGFGVVLIVPDEQGVDSVLLKLLKRDAVAADVSGNAA
ncbi:hypothetical protein QH494_15170 [Sphingomonas sp. AR_OL41]|uniref:hypothetical protein n=1 Tax=Sphingomonas sp. AR_OL41 TaxID=3042729 RepID=UPI00248014A1|nr:hypothetical protein [Sphingomonas sp. AR_OL41]MDH7973530.1 hypothetical protein [Sphingomonas sp. AR_OL41]